MKSDHSCPHQLPREERLNYRELFTAIHQRPGMWGLDGSYGQFCAFLLGCNEGTSQALLTGFDEWLRMRFQGKHRPTNVAWPGLILWLAFPENWRSTPLWADPTVALYELAIPRGTQTDPFETNDEARRAVEMLFRLLDEFLEMRQQRLGLSKIFTDYALWLQSEPADSSSPENIAQRIADSLNDEAQ